MDPLPRISVVTSSYNQGRLIAETIESVLAQHYPDLEHIVVDGMSGDETPQVLARYPHLRVIREPDRGQADAINKGFRHATGDILCFLNSDDTFLPGALHRVAREIDPVQGRHVVVGRCLYTDEAGDPVGMEHTWYPTVTHRRLLEVWKGNCIPQPATFWTAQAWRTCGPLDEAEHAVLDYDLMCCFGSRYRLHTIDQVLATYRLHTASKSVAFRKRDVQALSVRASRRYWGSPLRPLYWQLTWSLARSKMYASAVRLKRRLRRLALGLFGACEPRGLPAQQLGGGGALSAFTRMWRGFTGRHPDGCIGPTFLHFLPVESEHQQLFLRGASVVGRRPPEIDIAVFIDGRHVQAQRQDRRRDFSLMVPLAGLSAGRHQLMVVSSAFFVPHDFLCNEDYRPLAFRLDDLRLSGVTGHERCLLQEQPVPPSGGAAA